VIRALEPFSISITEERATAMAWFVGLDVSVQETSVGVVDEAGKVLAERKVETEPDAIIALLKALAKTTGGWARDDGRVSSQGPQSPPSMTTKSPVR
jgi:hypothetical protein